MVVYNRTITENLQQSILRARGHPPPADGREAFQAREPLEDAPSSLEQSYTTLRKKKYIQNKVQNYNLQTIAQQIKNPYALGGTPSDSRKGAAPSPGAVKGPPSSITQTLYRLPQMRKEKYATNYKIKILQSGIYEQIEPSRTISTLGGGRALQRSMDGAIPGRWQTPEDWPLLSQ